jgi:hypothetical protein
MFLIKYTFGKHKIQKISETESHSITHKSNQPHLMKDRTRLI